MPTIRDIQAREILDSRGNPTVEAIVTLSDGFSGRAAVPSGASTGSHEALELRDGGARYGGKGVRKAVRNVNEVIANAIIGMEVQQQRKIDARMIELDGTVNKGKLGANAILAVSLAAARAGSASVGLPLYRYLRDIFGLEYGDWRMPFASMNVLNGGMHAGWNIDFQECMIIPRQRSFKERVRCGAEVFYALKAILEKKGFATTVGDEGGFAPKLKRNAAALDLVMSAIRSAHYKPGKDVGIGMDPASSEFYNTKTRRYVLKTDGKSLSAAGMTAYYSRLCKKYPIIFLEDACAEEDWEGWRTLTAALGDKTAIVGDDLFVTSADRLRIGIAAGAGNAILIKVNQIGTLSETMDAVLLAQKHGYRVAVSHRSGETADTTIADLSVAVRADFIKTGSLSRSERVEKYNRLMEIEDETLNT